MSGMETFEPKENVSADKFAWWCAKCAVDGRQDVTKQSMMDQMDRFKSRLTSVPNSLMDELVRCLGL